MSVFEVHKRWIIRVGGIAVSRTRRGGAFIVDKEATELIDDLSAHVNAQFVRVTFLDNAGEKIREIDARLI
jgi:hypothetical protein